MRRLVLSALSTLALACTPSTSPPVDAGVDAPDAWQAATYANVALLFERSCSFMSCHGGAGMGAAHLNFAAAHAAGTPYTTLLVGVPACEYSAMPLVTAGDPDASWLYLKVAGPHTGLDVEFTPSPTWDSGLVARADGTFPPSICPLTTSGRIDFGAMMPQGTMGLTPSDADLLRRWIADGAPGP